MKPKAKTLIERHGFLDPDQKTTRHDEIQLWAYRNLKEILESLSGDHFKYEIEKTFLEFAIFQEVRSFKNIVGFVDLFALGKKKNTIDNSISSFYIAIEIKSEIESCGELIRQINFYRQFAPNFLEETTWLVICPNDRFQNILEDQRIRFFKYKPMDQLF